MSTSKRMAAKRPTSLDLSGKSSKKRKDDITYFKGAKDILSNFYSCNFKYEGFYYNCVEQAYQSAKAHKCGQDDIAVEIKLMTSGFQMWMAAKKIKNLDEWIGERVNVMRDIIQAKADYCVEYREKLLACDGLIVEAVTSDLFWAAGMDQKQLMKKDPSAWPGQNIMGGLHMKLRDSIRANGSSVLPECSPPFWESFADASAVQPSESPEDLDMDNIVSVVLLPTPKTKPVKLETTASTTAVPHTTQTAWNNEASTTAVSHTAQTAWDIDGNTWLSMEEGKFGKFIKLSRGKRFVAFSPTVWMKFRQQVPVLHECGEVILTENKSVDVVEFNGERYISFKTSWKNATTQNVHTSHINIHHRNWIEFLSAICGIDTLIPPTEVKPCEQCKIVKKVVPVLVNGGRMLSSNLSEQAAEGVRQNNLTSYNQMGLQCEYCGGYLYNDECHCHLHNCRKCEPDNFCTNCGILTVFAV